MGVSDSVFGHSVLRQAVTDMDACHGMRIVYIGFLWHFINECDTSSLIYAPFCQILLHTMIGSDP